MRRNTDPNRRIPVGILTAAAVTAILALGATVRAQTDAATPDLDARDFYLRGAGQSYWGPIPARSDSTTARFERRPHAWWEYPLGLPYEAAKLPFRLVRTGLEAGFIYLDDNHVFGRVAKWIGPRRGPFGVAVSVRAGGLSGFGGGLTFTHDAFFSPRGRFKLRWHSTVLGAHKISTGIHLRCDTPTQLILGTGFHRRPNARYFGIGPHTNENDEAYYTQDVTWGGATLRRGLSTHLLIEGTVLLSAVAAGRPRDIDDDDRAIDDLPQRERPVGYGQSSEAVSAGLTLLRDTTEETGRPLRGSVQRLKFARTWDLGSHGAPAGAIVSNFWTLRAEVQQFVPLWYSKQALALRLFTIWIEPDERARMPFQRLLTNDDPDLLRGYEDFRWRDRGFVALTVEYRWPLWANRTADGEGLDIYLFSDIGQLFDEFSEISNQAVTASYGCGVRFIGIHGFMGRCEIAWSEEDVVLRLRSDQIFQFAKGGLLHGRDQFALR